MFVLVFFLKSDNPGDSAFRMLAFVLVSCPATFLLEANLATEDRYSNFQIKHRIERDSRNWTQDSEIKLKHSIRPTHVRQGHMLVGPSLVLPGCVSICLVMDFSLVVTAGAVKALWFLKVSQGGCKQLKILLVELLLDQSTENLGIEAQKWIFSPLHL